MVDSMLHTKLFKHFVDEMRASIAYYHYRNSKSRENDTFEKFHDYSSIVRRDAIASTHLDT